MKPTGNGIRQTNTSSTFKAFIYVSLILRFLCLIQDRISPGKYHNGAISINMYTDIILVIEQNCWTLSGTQAQDLKPKGLDWLACYPLKK